jgi:hypothetical protein
VPKPARAIFNLLCVGLFLLLDANLSFDFDFVRFAFAAKSSPRSE